MDTPKKGRPLSNGQTVCLLLMYYPYISPLKKGQLHGQNSHPQCIHYTQTYTRNKLIGIFTQVIQILMYPTCIYIAVTMNTHHMHQTESYHRLWMCIVMTIITSRCFHMHQVCACFCTTHTTSTLDTTYTMPPCHSRDVYTCQGCHKKHILVREPTCIYRKLRECNSMYYFKQKPPLQIRLLHKQAHSL